MGKHQISQNLVDLVALLQTRKTPTAGIRKAIMKETGWGKTKTGEVFHEINTMLKSGAPENQNLQIIETTANTLEDVVSQCGVDQTKWMVDDFSVKELSGGGFLWTVYFKKKVPDKLIDFIKKDIQALAPKAKKINYDAIKENPLLLEFGFPDLHFSKLAWGEETGQNYDIKIARNRVRKALNETLNQIAKFPVARILVPIGNDFFNTDTLTNTTTSGTPQDVDSRHHKMFREGYKLIIETLEKLKEIAPVDVLACPGNHDQAGTLYLAELLQCYYHNDPNVNVDTEPKLRKYYRWGTNLLGFTHGDKEKINDLAVLMATERPKDWSETKFRAWHLGHFHTRRMWMDEKCGVLVEVLPSLSGTDDWHHQKGYVNNVQGVVSSLYDREKGQIGKLFYNIG